MTVTTKPPWRWCTCCTSQRGYITTTTGQFEYMPDPYRPPYKPKHAKSPCIEVDVDPDAYTTFPAW